MSTTPPATPTPAPAPPPPTPTPAEIAALVAAAREAIAAKEKAQRFLLVLKLCGYDENEHVFKWTSLTEIPEDCPKTHMDAVGWFKLQRTAARILCEVSPMRARKSVEYTPSNLLKMNMESIIRFVTRGATILYRTGQSLGNEIFLQLSPKLTVGLHFMNGTKITANEILAAGEVVVKDTAFATLAFKGSKHSLDETLDSKGCRSCDYCMELIQQGKMLTCANCTKVFYCSQTCFEKAEAEYHTFECGVFDGLGLDMQNTDKDWVQHLVLTLRALCKCGPRNLYRNVGQPDYSALEPVNHPNPLIDAGISYMPGSVDAMFDSRTIHAAMNMGLAGNFADSPHPELCNLVSIEANVVLRVLEERTEFFQHIPMVLNMENYKCKVGAVAFQILLGLKSKTVKMTSRKFCSGGGAAKEAGDCRQMPVEHQNGIGIYPTVALLKHSCAPNAFLAFKGTECYVISNRPISKNEEITISWINTGICSLPTPHVLNSEAEKERKLMLMKATMDLAKFCACKLCEDPLESLDQFSETPTKFTCLNPKCAGPDDLSLPIVRRPTTGRAEFVFHCWVCGWGVDYLPIKQKIRAISDTLEQEKAAFANGNFELNPRKTLEAIWTLWQCRAHGSRLEDKLYEFLQILVTFQNKYETVSAQAQVKEG